MGLPRPGEWLGAHGPFTTVPSHYLAVVWRGWEQLVPRLPPRLAGCGLKMSAKWTGSLVA